ncbi:MAG: hypothetical protein WA874_04385 [Chryseosolibacter sp.]
METKTSGGLDRKIADSHTNIEGWGIDADPENDPTYPMKHYTGADHDRLNYERAPQQTRKEEVLYSNERPGITRVFGTSSPPSGVSGMLRRYAFKFSEGSAGHWMTLLLADRVNVVEGIIDDLAHGHVPNLIAERGWRAEWKYNREGAVKKIVVGVAITSAVIALLAYRAKSNRKVAASRSIPL